jgi:ribonuclease BN (tRNA processing enzyme)
MSTAVVIDGDVYLVDFGAGWLRRYQQAGLGGAGPGSGLQNLRAAFVTHLHADHIADLSHLFLFGGSEGLASKHGPVRIFGPGNRGKLPPIVGGDPGGIPVVNAASPTPGLVETVDRLFDAFATDVNDNIRDSRRPDPRSQLDIREVQLPVGLVNDPNIEVAPPMDPVFVYSDDKVRVTAILVEHAPVFPSFAYRFDTAKGSVVVSGDTAPSENLVKLAKGADLLVHEVIDTSWVDSLFPNPKTPAQAAKARHLVESHTAIEQVGPIAQAAGVRTLVLSHFAPADGRDERWKLAQRGFSGRLVVGHDREWISVTEGRK